VVAVQKRDMIDDVIIIPRATGFGRPGITSDCGKPFNGDQRKALQVRSGDAGIDAITCDRCLIVGCVVDAIKKIPAKAEIVYPIGIGSPGPARGEERGGHVSERPEVGLSADCILPDPSALAAVVGAAEGMVITQVVIEFADTVTNGENIRKPLGDGAAGSRVGPVLWQEAHAERVKRDSRTGQSCLGGRNAHTRIRR